METFILTHGSYLAIVLILALSGMGLPLPEEVPVVAAGILSSEAVGQLNPFLGFAACVVGAISGDCLMYWMGRLLGHRLLKRHSRFAFILDEDRQVQTEKLIRKHGLQVFLLARFLVGVRSPIYLAAGILRVSFRRFLIVDALCATIVVAAFFWSSHFFGAWISSLIHDSQLLVTSIVAIVALVAAFYLLVLKTWRANTSPDASGEDFQPSQIEPAGRAFALSEVNEPVIRDADPQPMDFGVAVSSVTQ